MDANIIVEEEALIADAFYFKSCLNCDSWKNMVCDLGKTISDPKQAFCIMHKLKE